MLALKSAGVDVLVSLLTDDDARRFGLEAEAERAAFRGIEFLRFPIEDHQVPVSVDETVAFAQALLGRLEQGRSVVLHCYAGIGRSGLVAATVLFLAGLEIEDACWRLSEARGMRVPETAKQREWLEALVRSS